MIQKSTKNYTNALAKRGSNSGISGEVIEVEIRDGNSSLKASQARMEINDGHSTLKANLTKF
jgi:hypothetical protein